jgi:tetratricopeptide (TPR) repeat protein
VALSLEAQALGRTGAMEDAQDKWVEAVRILDGLGQPVEYAEVQLRLGNFHFREENYDQAQACYERAAERARRKASPELYARIQNTRAAVLLQRGKPADALLLFQEAAEIRRSIGNRSGLAQSMHNIAYCHHELGDIQEARRIYEEVLAVRAAIGQTAERASSQRNYAGALMDLGRLEQAWLEINEALAAKRQSEDRVYIPPCLTLLGEIELELGRTEHARAAYMEVLRDFEDQSEEVFRSELGMARLEWLSGRAPQAEQHFARALGSPESRTPAEDSFVCRYQALVFFRSSGAALDRLRDIAEPVAGMLPRDLQPSTRLVQCLVRAELSAAEDAPSEAREQLRDALSISQSLGTSEWTWRIHRAQARLEPEGSEARAAENKRAAAIIERQAKGFTNRDLRNAYLSHRQRAEALRDSAAIEPSS